MKSKSNNPRRLSIATVGCLAALALPLSAQTVEPSSVDRGSNRGSTIPRDQDTRTTTTPVYNPDRPIDRNNKPVPPHDRTTRGAALTRGDHRIVKKAAACTNYETALSRQASSRASLAEVRSYADTLVRDHERMRSELAAFAAGRGVMMPSGDRYRDDLDDLAQKTGTDYDEAYLEEMIDSHEDSIRLLEKAAESDNSDFAAFAVQHLPTLRDHLARAKQLEEAVD
jgi:putative membrane protein